MLSPFGGWFFLRGNIMGDIYVLYAEMNRGKSSTLKEVYRILSLKYPNLIDVKSILNPEGYDVTVEMYDSKGFVRDIKRIGIGSHGDNKKVLYESLTVFAKHKCDIIFCTERVSSNIFSELEKLNKKSRDSILKKTTVGEWVDDWNLNQPSSSDQYQITHFLPRIEHKNNTANENYRQAKKMIKRAGL